MAVAPNGRLAGCSPCSTTKRPHPWLYKWNLKNADEGEEKRGEEDRGDGGEGENKKKQRRERGRTERREKPREEKKKTKT